MVFYFTTTEGFTVYMGKDKYENEDLLKYGFLEDVWFHVDNLSSAHVYLRLPMGKAKLDDITPTALEECAQLVKANSIEGSKKNNVRVVYTKYRNLRKTQGMAVGEVGFHDMEKVRKVVVKEKINSIVNDLNRTKKELYPDLEDERRKREQLYKARRKEHRRKQEAEEKKIMAQRQKEAELRSYKGVFSKEKMRSNKEYEATEDSTGATAFEDDFM